MDTPLGLIVAASIAATVFSPIGQVRAASFSCMETDQLSAAEQRVCGSSTLGAYDERVDHWYQRATVRAGYFDQTEWLRQEQRQWLEYRNSCGIRYWCLSKRYRQRIRALKNYVLHV